MMITPFIAGRGGRVQAEIAGALVRAGFDLDDVPDAELDLLDRRACRRAVARAHADVVIDCNGADDVGCVTALSTDELLVGVENLARAAAKENAHSIFISNASVFGDVWGGPRVESDPPAPTSAIGDALLHAERITARVNGQHTILRSTTLYGARWGLVADLIGRVHAGERILIEACPVWAPTYAPHLADVLVTLARRPCYGILHRAASGECTQLDFARAVTTLVDHQYRLELSPAASQHNMPETAPACLATRRPGFPVIPHWRIGLRLCALESEDLRRPARQNATRTLLGNGTPP
ncbi:MAG: sugar nucleotide-binding protein [Solirubrobacterales bacterium]|nr:sugar nucleotide-binding protein [Solirubrobacterales bacterium]